MNENNQDVPAAPVKRPRGNPNFGKKKTGVEKEVLRVETVTEVAGDKNVFKYQYVESESDVWLKLYGSILSGYQNSGPAICKAAALNADAALAEYKARYVK